MEKCTFTGFFWRLVLMALLLVDKIAMDDIKATVSWSSNTITTFLGNATFNGNKGSAQFFGVRYGEPPVGERRFQKSTLYEYGNEIVNATKHDNICPQRRKGNGLISKTDKMGEDCLFLNIIVPLDAVTENVSKIVEKKAVYIFFHGGVFLRGSSNLYVTTGFVMHGDFIAVTLNYRLGIFGFLTTDDDVMPANLGLWDQQLAIKWVKENIGAFGGDSSRITVGGHSAGSMAAVLQSFYEGNDDLFQNTIAESGSPFAAKVIVEKGLPMALEVAKMSGCDISSKKGDKLSKGILKCLSEKSVTFLADLPDTQTTIGPVLDNDFIARETFELCPQGLSSFTYPKSISSSFANKNLLTGFTSEDGEVLMSLVLDKVMTIFSITDRAEFLKRPITHGLLRIILKNYLLTNKTEADVTTKTIVNAVMEHYTDWSKPSNRVATSMDAVKIMTEYFFIYPGIKTALLHSLANTCRMKSSNCGEKKASTYLYEFRYPPTSLLAVNSDFPWFKGTRHGAELFLFADAGLNKQLPELSETLFTTWSNFIKTGNPNSGNSNDWKEYSKKSPNMYLVTDKSKPIQTGAYSKSIHFWQDYLPGLQDNFRAALGNEVDSGTKTETECALQKNHNNGGVGHNAVKHVLLLVVSLIIASFKL